MIRRSKHLSIAWPAASPSVGSAFIVEGTMIRAHQAVR